jgi:hypothetical protein
MPLSDAASAPPAGVPSSDARQVCRAVACRFTQGSCKRLAMQPTCCHLATLPGEPVAACPIRLATAGLCSMPLHGSNTAACCRAPQHGSYIIHHAFILHAFHAALLESLSHLVRADVRLYLTPRHAMCSLGAVLTCMSCTDVPQLHGNVDVLMFLNEDTVLSRRIKFRTPTDCIRHSHRSVLPRTPGDAE